MTKFSMISAALAATLLAGSVSAQTAQKTVRYGDLDLAKAAGARTFDARLRAAARDVCGVGDARHLSDVAASGRCYDATVAGVRSQMGRIAARTGA